PIISDNHRQKKYEIILGYNRHLEVHKADIPDVNLESDGFLIITRAESLVILGGEKKGLLNGIYSFLEQYLDCRMYTSGTIVIPTRNNIYLPEIHDYQVPAFRLRDVHYRDAYVPEYAEWHGLTSIHRQEMGLGVHSFERLAHPDKYFESHPEYYSLIDGKRVHKAQLCLSNKDLVDVVEANLRELMKKSPEKEYWGVGQNDNDSYCQCEECRAINEREGSQSGTIIHFVNQIAGRFPDKTIVTLAYHYSRYIPMHIKPADNVNIFLASIECNRSKPISEDPQSRNFLEDLENWGEISDNIWVWDYVVHFHGYVSPYPNLHVLQPNIQLFAENNAGAMFQQGDLYGGGEFSELKAYLIAKLLWDPYMDIDSVMTDFLTGYYGEAGIYIQQYIDILHDASEIYGNNLHHKIDPLTHTDGYLSPVMIKLYHRIFDRAEMAVENDSAYLKRVKIARLPLEYIDLEIAKRKEKEEGGFIEKDPDGNFRPRVEMIEKLESFVNLCKEARVSCLKENSVTPDEYLQIKRSVEKSVQDHLAIGCPVQSKTPANPEFSGADVHILTDGFRGSMDWTYAWLGYKDDMEVIIDLGGLKEIGLVQPEFIFDQKRWIFLPDYVVCSISKDGEHFEEVGKVTHNVPMKQKEPRIKTFDFEFENQNTRYIKIYAKNIGINPWWHRFAGGNASIFIDEIIVK
ncbi:MAG: DUF4838 domain-containing protein, partial [Bacteroidales bacterium]|nr:DUF4838 domain-containing protein [Bacteroidales bacterium]